MCVFMDFVCRHGTHKNLIAHTFLPMTSLKPNLGYSKCSIRLKNFYLEKLEIKIIRNLEANIFKIR